MAQWIASLHGDAGDLSAEDGEAAERTVLDALISVAEGLAGAGHQGIAATFHGAYTGDVNLLAPGEAPDAGPQIGAPPDPIVALGPGEVDRAEVTAAAGVEPGTPVPLAPGQSLAPEAPDAPSGASGDALPPPSDAPAPDAAPDTAEAS